MKESGNGEKDEKEEGQKSHKRKQTYIRTSLVVYVVCAHVVRDMEKSYQLRLTRTMSKTFEKEIEMIDPPSILMSSFALQSSLNVISNKLDSLPGSFLLELVSLFEVPNKPTQLSLELDSAS